MLLTLMLTILISACSGESDVDKILVLMNNATEQIDKSTTPEQLQNLNVTLTADIEKYNDSKQVLTEEDYDRLARATYEMGVKVFMSEDPSMEFPSYEEVRESVIDSTKKYKTVGEFTSALCNGNI